MAPATSRRFCKLSIITYKVFYSKNNNYNNVLSYYIESYYKQISHAENIMNAGAGECRRFRRGLQDEALGEEAPDHER